VGPPLKQDLRIPEVLSFNPMELKNIIFDLGGVIIDLDYQKTTQAFINLGVTDFDAIYSKAKQSDIFDNFEKGIVDEKQFRSFIRSKIDVKLEDIEIDKAWNAMLIDFPARRVEWLKQVSKKYRIFLLSNTNPIHIASFKGIADNLFGKDVFLQIFEKVYLSSEIGMRKPDANIFEKVLVENNLKKEETLFIDDSIQHIIGALAINLKAELLKVEDGEKIEVKYKYLLY
jgi:glucose-1-phosphatase